MTSLANSLIRQRNHPYVSVIRHFRSLGGAEIGWNLYLGLRKFENNELQRHFIEWISISSAFIVFIKHSSSRLGKHFQ